MKTLVDYINNENINNDITIDERRAQPILNENQLNRAWNIIKSRMGQRELIDALYDCMDFHIKNEVLWQLEQKYGVNAYPNN